MRTIRSISNGEALDWIRGISVRDFCRRENNSDWKVFLAAGDVVNKLIKRNYKPNLRWRGQKAEFQDIILTARTVGLNLNFIHVGQIWLDLFSGKPRTLFEVFTHERS